MAFLPDGVSSNLFDGRDDGLNDVWDQLDAAIMIY